MSSRTGLGVGLALMAGAATIVLGVHGPTTDALTAIAAGLAGVGLILVAVSLRAIIEE